MHEPGRVTDALVAGRVMSLTVTWLRDSSYQRAPWLLDGAEVTTDLRGTGRAWIRGLTDDGDEVLHRGGRDVPHYSTSIADAWLVVERMAEWVPAYRALRLESAGAGYLAAFYSHQHPLDRPGAFAHGDTAPLAICRAALLALQVAEPGGDHRTGSRRLGT